LLRRRRGGAAVVEEEEEDTRFQVGQESDAAGWMADAVLHRPDFHLRRLVLRVPVLAILPKRDCQDWKGGEIERRKRNGEREEEVPAVREPTIIGLSLSLSLSLSLRSSSWLRLAAAEHGLVARDQSTVRGATWCGNPAADRGVALQSQGHVLEGGQ
jgi:hypothetical protein